MSLTKVPYSMINGAPVNVLDYGAIADNITDSTTAIQSALNALPTTGGTVVIPSGVKFNLKSLTFPEKSNMEYYVGSDTSNPGSASDIDSGELVFFSANSSYPSDPTGAAVNEWRFTAPFHPGIVVDVRKDVTGQDAHLAPGQDRTDPARASFNIMDEQVGRFNIQYQNYSSGSNFSGVFLNNYRTQIVINGVGTSNWGVAPAVGDQVYQTSGSTTIAAGFIVSQTTSTTTVVWTQGKFVAGSPLKYGVSNTSTSNVTSAVYTNTPMPWLAQDFVKGGWSIGLPPQTAEESFTVGGRIVSTSTRDAGQYKYKTITNPGYGFISSYESNTRGRWMVCESANDYKRVVLKDVTDTNTVGQVGACGAHVSFNNAATVSSSNFNVTSITRNGTGDYTITFTSAFARSDYTVSLSTAAPLDFAYVYAKNTGTLQIKVVQTGTSTPRDLTGLVGIACFGGDI